jgi:hypothetical protein
MEEDLPFQYEVKLKEALAGLEKIEEASRRSGQGQLNAGVKKLSQILDR